MRTRPPLLDLLERGPRCGSPGARTAEARRRPPLRPPLPRPPAPRLRPAGQPLHPRAPSGAPASAPRSPRRRPQRPPPGVPPAPRSALASSPARRERPTSSRRRSASASSRSRLRLAGHARVRRLLDMLDLGRDRAASAAHPTGPLPDLVDPPQQADGNVDSGSHVDVTSLELARVARRGQRRDRRPWPQYRASGPERRILVPTTVDTARWIASPQCSR